MIEIKDTKAIVRFSSGNIGYSIYSVPSYRTVCLALSDNNEIAKESSFEDIFTAPVMLSFHDIESIDEMIKKLSFSKNLLIQMHTDTQKI